MELNVYIFHKYDFSEFVSLIIIVFFGQSKIFETIHFYVLKSV